MNLTQAVMRSAHRGAQVAAFVAVLFLALNPVPLLAHSLDSEGHSHFGPLCQALDGERGGHHSEGDETSPHGDCLHHFDLFVRALAAQHLPLSIPRQAGREPDRAWELPVYSEPRPPRLLS